MSTTADLNDYSSRVNITGVTIASIPIDIVAQTIGNIAIDIASASMGSIAISINVADIVGNIPIDVAAQSVGNIAIDVAAQTVGNIGIDLAANTLGNLTVDIAAQTMIGNLTVDIAAQTVGNIGIDIAANSFGNLPIDIVAQTVGNIGISLNANTAGNITVDIAAQTMVGNLSIDIAANSFGNLPIDIVAQTIGNIGINLAANTLGNLTIDIAAQTVGNIAIDVAAQTVDLNIKTSGGVNIIIDKLTQGAYTERRSLIRNDNGVGTPTAPPASYTNVTYKGKFYPRGMRGVIQGLYIYCKRTAAGTITLSYAPHPGMGAVGSVVITPAAAWDWKGQTVNSMWNYDSLFIWVSACSADVSYGYDTAAPYDYHQSTDAGVTWEGLNQRLFIYLYLYGETVGDIPVSGTLNTIEILPVTSQFEYLAEGLVDGGTTRTVLDTVNGSGKMTCFIIMIYMQEGSTPPGVCYVRITVDGVLFEENMDVLYRTLFQTKTVSPVSFNSYDDAAEEQYYSLAFNFPVAFRRTLKIEVRNSAAAGNKFGVRGIVAYDLAQ